MNPILYYTIFQIIMVLVLVIGVYIFFKENKELIDNYVLDEYLKDNKWTKWILLGVLLLSGALYYFMFM